MPATLEDLAPYAFSTPVGDPSGYSTLAANPALAIDQHSREGISFREVTTSESGTYGFEFRGTTLTLMLPRRIDSALRWGTVDTSMLNPFDRVTGPDGRLNFRLVGKDESPLLQARASWMALDNYSREAADPEDARYGLVQRELEFMLHDAALAALALPNSVPDLERWSGCRLINLEPSEPATAMFTLGWDRAQTYRLTTRWPGGHVQETVLYFTHLGFQDAAVRYHTLRADLFDQEVGRVFEPLGAWDLVSIAGATLPE